MEEWCLISLQLHFVCTDDVSRVSIDIYIVESGGKSGAACAAPTKPPRWTTNLDRAANYNQPSFCFQFTAWVDAVIFVFSLENESSFNAIYNYYTKMSHYRNTSEIPLILVGTQGLIYCDGCFLLLWCTNG